MVIKDKDMVFDASTHMACINLYQTEPSNKMESEQLHMISPTTLFVENPETYIPEISVG